ncbi:MAG: hypothetical protein QOI54_2474 [Actinomycetota bacterium]|nr:hypothetical protein [Actinomycetota bacterium]
MLRFLLRPRWLAWHAVLVAVLVAFTWLGWWQLGSFERRGQPSLATRAAVRLDDVTRAGGRLQDEDILRRVVTRGRYDAAHQLLVPGREHGARRGWFVVTPLRSASGVLPVLRGWVPRPSSAAARVPSGTVTVRGRLQASEPREASAVDPLEALPAGQVAYVATVTMLDAWPYPAREIYDGYLVLSRQSPAASPSPARVQAQQPSEGVSRWRNLAYALQWWLFSAAAVFFWASVLRRAWADEHEAPLTDRAPLPAETV